MKVCFAFISAEGTIGPTNSSVTLLLFQGSAFGWRLCLPGASAAPQHLLEHTTHGVGWSGDRAEGRGLSACPLRRDLVRFLTLWQCLGKGWRALMGCSEAVSQKMILSWGATVGTPASSWLCGPCLALCSLGLFPPLGAGPSLLRGRIPGEGPADMEQVQTVCGEQVTGTGAGTWGHWGSGEPSLLATRLRVTEGNRKIDPFVLAFDIARFSSILPI